MSHASETLHYQLPQYSGTDIINPLVDTNDAYSKIDTALYEIAGAASDATSVANEVKETIKGSGGVDDRIDALVTRVDAVEAKDVAQDASILQLNSGLATTDANLATLSGNVNTLDGTVAGHTTAIGQLTTRVGACENADTALDARVTALEGATTEIDSAMSDSSENAVQNKVIKAYVDDKDAEHTPFNDVGSHFSANNVQDAIEHLDAEGHSIAGELQTATLATGATSATVNFTQEIKATTIITPVCSIYGVSPTAVTYTAHSITLTFEAQASDAIVGARIQNII